MATLEDKILGEKLHNYCSSSEDESDGENSEKTSHSTPRTQDAPALPEANKWDGTSQNTGPKGVIEDWRRYKQLQNEKRVEQEQEYIALAKKLTLSVKSALDEEKEAALEDPDLADLLDDKFLLEYQKQRMQEMLQQHCSGKKFGGVIYLKNGEEYLDAIDKEDKGVNIIIHIFEEHIAACRLMNKCLEVLAKVYSTTKFCAIIGSVAGLSRDFKSKGLPALLVYKSGNLINSFVRVSDDLGDDFVEEDVKDFLVEHGLLDDKHFLPGVIKESSTADDSD